MNWDWEKLQEKKRRQSSGGGGNPPPDFEELKRKFQNLTNFKAPWILIVIAIVVLLWLASGFYIVNPDEVGVVKRFGAFNRITQSGPHYHFPYPIETAVTPNVTQIRRVELGFISSERFEGGWRPVKDEALMLTGDENIVSVQCIVQFRIKNAMNYLFNISDPPKAVKDAISAAMRQVVGQREIDDVLTVEKTAIQNDAQELVQEILDSYDSGVDVTAVKLQDVHPPEETMAAFKDVASAREDKSKFINNAKAYRNNIIPRARGQAAGIINEAKGYKESKIRQAKGESERFLKLLQEYSNAKQVTEKRLYLETMEQIFSGPGVDKIILSNEAANNIVPFLPLERLKKSQQKTDAQIPQMQGGN